jgi:hypothetical protein
MSEIRVKVWPIPTVLRERIMVALKRVGDNRETYNISLEAAMRTKRAYDSFAYRGCISSDEYLTILSAMAYNYNAERVVEFRHWWNSKLTKEIIGGLGT